SAVKRKNGASPELDEEIRMLGERYGIPTEFTSYLVQEPVSTLGAALPRREMRRDAAQLQQVGAGGVAGTVAAPPMSKDGQFNAAKSAAEQRAVTSIAMLDWAVAAPNGTMPRVDGRSLRLPDGAWSYGRW